MTNKKQMEQDMNAVQTIVSTQSNILKENKMENTLKNNNSDLKFDLRFNDNYTLDVIFNDSPDARLIKVSDYTVTQYASWLGHAIDLHTPFYTDMKEGFMMHRSLADVKALRMPDSNVGYVFGANLRELVENKIVCRVKEINDDETYRIMYTFPRFSAAELPYVEWSDTEPDYNGQNRNARALVERGIVLHTIANAGNNLHLVFFESKAQYFNNFKHQWDLFVNGQYETLSTYREQLRTGGMIKNGLKKAAAVLAEDPSKARLTFTRKDEVVDYGHLVGQTVMFARVHADKSVEVYPNRELDLTAEQLPEVMEVIRKYSLILVTKESVFAPQADEVAPVAEAPVPTRKHRRNALHNTGL